MQPAATYKSHTEDAFLLKKAEALRARAALLTGLDKVVATRGDSCIKPAQWGAINRQLTAAANRVLTHLQGCTDHYLSGPLPRKGRHLLANTLGAIELELSEAYSFYDTYMDILTQRLSPVLGPLLAGCDVIAADGLKHPFLIATTRNPIVYCDRGFGASILREGMRITHAVNPVAFIAIPYSRLAEKYNLISIYHEVGHQALAKLGLVETFPKMLAACVQAGGGNQLTQGLFANWSKEIMPDFWAFGHTGMAQTSSMRDVLLVPGAMAMQVSPYMQHPPPYLRFLFSVAWCRVLWGRGDWDGWAEEWETLYPLDGTDSLTRQAIQSAKKLLPRVAEAILNTRFRSLGRKTITSLFNMDAVAPERLADAQKAILANRPSSLPVGVQLAAFRLQRDWSGDSIDTLNDAMHSWLLSLNQQRITQYN